MLKRGDSIAKLYTKFIEIPHENEIFWLQRGGGGASSEPLEPPLNPPLNAALPNLTPGP